MDGKHTPYGRLTKQYLDWGFQIIKSLKNFTFGIQHFSSEAKIVRKKRFGKCRRKFGPQTAAHWEENGRESPRMVLSCFYYPSTH